MKVRGIVMTSASKLFANPAVGPRRRSHALIGLLLPLLVLPQVQPSAQHTALSTEREAALKGFTDRVNAYVDLKKKLDDGLPAMKPGSVSTGKAESHEAILARRIREARADAKPGAIFGDAAALFSVGVSAQQPRPAQPAAPALTIQLPNREDSVKFAAIGDNGTGECPQYEVAERMVEARARFPFEFVIMLGDNMYGRQRPEDFVLKFERPYKTLLDAGVKFYAALGNHDEQENRFHKPWNMDGGRCYTYSKKNVRFFVLDSDYMDPKQLDWLTEQLQRSNDEWKVVYFHHPLYSSAGRHGSETDLRLILEPLFVRHGVNVVLSGHDHTYERIKPQKGIYYFVSGSAGQLRRGDLQRTTLTAVGYDQDQAFMLVEIDKDAMSVQAISRSGKTADAVTLPRQERR